MNTQEQKPLWKKLNELRSQGIIGADKRHLEIFPDTSKHPHAIGRQTFGTINSIFIPEKQAQANANYTVLCLNNFAQMGDTLEWIIKEIETTPDDLQEALLGMIKIKCCKALSNIS